MNPREAVAGWFQSFPLYSRNMVRSQECHSRPPRVIPREVVARVGDTEPFTYRAIFWPAERVPSSVHL